MNEMGTICLLEMAENQLSRAEGTKQICSGHRAKNAFLQKGKTQRRSLHPVWLLGVLSAGMELGSPSACDIPREGDLPALRKKLSVVRSGHSYSVIGYTLASALPPGYPNHQGWGHFPVCWDSCWDSAVPL